MENLSDKELLQFALENGIINLNNLQAQIEMNERKKYLEMHKNKIWQDKNGKYKTCVPDETAKNGRRLIERKNKQDLEDCIIAAYKNLETEPYIKNIFYSWLDSKYNYGEISKQTYDRYEGDFIRYFTNTRIYNTKFRYITEDMLEDFIKSTIHNKNLTAKMWANLRTIIYGVFKFAKKRNYTNISITHFMGDLELSRKVFRTVCKTDEAQVFKDKEVQQIKKYIFQKEPDILEYGIIFAFLTGLRVGELSALTYNDFDMENRTVTITKTEIHYKNDDGKTIYEVRPEPKTEAGNRSVILNDEAIALYKKIRALNPFGEYLFEKKNKRIKGYLFSRRLYLICDKLNIVKKSMHKARKTYGTKLINANVDERLIMQQMGHKDISTTRKYYLYNNKTDEEQLRQIQNAISY